MHKRGALKYLKERDKGALSLSFIHTDGSGPE
jgi:hypothetical protein